MYIFIKLFNIIISCFSAPPTSKKQVVAVDFFVDFFEIVEISRKNDSNTINYNYYFNNNNDQNAVKQCSWFLYISIYSFVRFVWVIRQTPTSSWHGTTCCGKLRFKSKIYGFRTYKSFFTQHKCERNFIWHFFEFSDAHLNVIFTSSLSRILFRPRSMGLRQQRNIFCCCTFRQTNVTLLLLQ